MERAPEGDDAGPTRDPSGELERGFDSLGPGVAEEDGVQRIRAGVGQHGGQPCHRLDIAQGVADVEQLVGLVLDRLGYGRVMVTERRGGDAAGEVQESAAGRVEQGVALAVAPAALVVAAQDRREVRLRDRGEVAGIRQRVDFRRSQVANRRAGGGNGGGGGDDLILGGVHDVGSSKRRLPGHRERRGQPSIDGPGRPPADVCLSRAGWCCCSRRSQTGGSTFAFGS